MVIQRPNALDPVSCTALMGAYNSYRAASKVRDYSGNPVVYYNRDWNNATARKAVEQTTRLGLSLAQLGLAGMPPLYPETVVLAMLPVGGHHVEHADNVRLERGKWVPNHTPMRTVSGLFYLNSDFDGGEIVFPQHGLSIKPVAGTFIAFPSDQHHTHLVKPVLRGRRYSMALWMTSDEYCRLGIN